MSHSKKRKEITALIDNIKVHSDRLTNNKNIPILELSVILSKIDRLKEKVVILKYILSEDYERTAYETNNSKDEAIQKEESKQSTAIKKEEAALENIIAAQIEASKESQPTKENKTIADLTEENLTTEKKTQVTTSHKESLPEETSVEINEKHEEDVKVEKTDSIEPATILPDLNEQYSEEDDPSLSEQLKKQPIADLLTAIGLNERYLYANELFDGNIGVFKEVVKTLNEQNSLEEAQQYFTHTLIKAYNWDSKNELVKALQLLVERRYL